MGNVTAVPPKKLRFVELRLSRPHLPGSDPWRLHVEVVPSSGDLGLWSAPSVPQRPRWEETFKIHVETDLELRILQGDHLVAKGVLEVSQVISNAPTLVFRVLAIPLVPKGTLEVKFRQASEDAMETQFQFQMPLARRQVISLELQNAELVKALRKTRGAAPSSGSLGKLHEFHEASHMRHQQLLEESYAVNAQLLQRKQYLRRRLAAMKMCCHSELPRLRQNLAKAIARQQQLQLDGEAKIASLQQRRQDAQEKVMPEIEVQALLALAMGRREELHGKLRRGSVAFSEGSEVPKLQKLVLEQHEELEQLREQIAHIERSGHYQAWKRHEDAVTMVQQLFQSLEELSQAMQDDQVCHESEFVELRQERNAIKDRLEEASTALRQLSAAAELLQVPLAEATEAPEWQRRCQRAEGELQELKRMECLRLQQIKDLELDQESLVEQTTLATALPGEDANHKMASLERNYNELQASVQSKRHQLDETRQICQQLREYVRRLHEQQLQLVSRADERVLRNPQPSQPAAARA